MIMLTVKELAELKGYSERYIKKLIVSGDIAAEETVNRSNRKKYAIPLSSLEPALQVKYYRKNALPLPPELRRQEPARIPKRVKSLEEFTERQRRQIEYRIGILAEWDEFRSSWADRRDMAAADAAFVKRYKAQHPREPLSVPTLYRYKKAHDEEDLDGLVDKRGQYRKGRSCIDDEVWKIFLTYYLEEGARYSMAKSWRLTKEYCEVARQHLLSKLNISIDAVEWRRKQEILLPVEEMKRNGIKAHHDRFGLYIRRLYDDMQSNEYWVPDNYTLDFMSADGSKVIHRLYLTAYLDARSGVIVGWQVTPKPCGDATLAALRNSIMPQDGRQTNGIPDNIYCDNGSEFLVHDIGGRGHRTRKKSEEIHIPPGVFARMGINMVNAIPGNPEAKLVERTFRIVKEEFCAAMDTYCGGNILEKPERLNRMLKSGKVPSDKEVTEIISSWITGYYNHMPYGGSVQKDRGKPRIQVYNENLTRIRMVRNLDDLNLLLMRSSRMVTVGRRGVQGVPLTIEGFRIDYWTPEFLSEWGGKKVYYRYDPQDLAEIRVYNEEDQFICTLPADNVAVLEYGAGKQSIQQAMRLLTKYNRLVREWTDGKLLTTDEKIAACDLMLIQARENIENPPEYATKRDNVRVIEFVNAIDDSYYEYPMAVGDSNELLTNMINTMRQRMEDKDE